MEKKTAPATPPHCETQQLSRPREGRTSSWRQDLLLLIPQVTVGGTALSVTNSWLSWRGLFFVCFFIFFLFKWKFRQYVNLWG